MISTKPYFLRAIREWALDNNLTPQMLVDASQDNVVVPDTYVNNSQILLNISDQAVNGLVLGNEQIVFSARFNGKPWQISIPIEAVMAIFTREDGQGIFFESSNTIVSAGVTLDSGSNESPKDRPRSGGPTRLGLAKGGSGSANSDAARGAQSDNDNASWADSKTQDGADENERGSKPLDNDADKPGAESNSEPNAEPKPDPDPDDPSPARRGRPNLRLVD